MLVVLTARLTVSDTHGHQLSKHFIINYKSMESPHWKACANFFRMLFPACHKCQGGHSTPEAMLLHLTASHYHQEALAAFGRGQTCPVCNKSLMPQKQSHRQHYILCHMAEHIVQFAPQEAKFKLKLVLEIDNENETQERKYIESVAEKQFSPITITKVPCMYSDDSGSGSNAKGRWKANILHSVTNKKPDKMKTRQKTNNPQNTHVHSESLWQECVLHFKKIYPSCKTCQREPESMRALKKHLTTIHYGDKAMRLFGKGRTCPICSKTLIVSSGQTKLRVGDIKNHMATHLEQFIQDDQARNLLLRARSSSQSQNRSNAKVTQKGKRAKAKHHKYFEGSHWQNSIAFFKKTFANCSMCQVATHKSWYHMIHHLFSVHFHREVLEAFGTSGGACQICHKDILGPSKKKYVYLKGRVIYHFMKCHRQHMIDSVDSEEARKVISMALQAIFKE